MTSKSQNHNPSGSEPCCQKRQHGSWQARGITRPNSNLQGRTYPALRIFTYLFYIHSQNKFWVSFFFFVLISNNPTASVSSFYGWCMHSKLLQLCPNLCDPTDHSPPSSSIHGILQAQIRGRVAISFSILCAKAPNYWKDKPLLQKVSTNSTFAHKCKRLYGSNNELTQGHLP